MAECKDCKGKGVIPLFTSLAECEVCKGRGKVLTEKERIKQKLISEYINTPAGRAKLAASLTQPIRRRRDYTSVGRNTFREKMAA